MTATADCELCQDMGAVLWDPVDQGPPPPPPGFEDRLWYWTWEPRQRECPACQGWGQAFNGPWAQAHRIATGTDNLASPKASTGFEAARQYVIRWYSDSVARDLVHAEAVAASIRQRYAMMEAVTLRRRALTEPEWPLGSMTAGCLNCNHSFNFAPTRHPLTGEPGVGCCECGFTARYEPSDAEKQKHANYEDKARQEAEGVMSWLRFPTATQALLLEKLCPSDVLRAVRSTRMLDQETLPESPR